MLPQSTTPLKPGRWNSFPGSLGALRRRGFGCRYASCRKCCDDRGALTVPSGAPATAQQAHPKILQCGPALARVCQAPALQCPELEELEASHIPQVVGSYTEPEPCAGGSHLPREPGRKMPSRSFQLVFCQNARLLACLSHTECFRMMVRTRPSST